MSIAAIVRTKGKRYQIQRAVFKTDSVGTRKKTFVNMHRIDAYVSSNSATESWDGDRQVQLEQVTLYAAGDADIKVQDRIQIGANTFEVKGIRRPGNRVAGDRHFYQIVNAESNVGI